MLRLQSSAFSVKLQGRFLSSWFGQVNKPHLNLLMSYNLSKNKQFQLTFGMLTSTVLCAEGLIRYNLFKCTFWQDHAEICTHISTNVGFSASTYRLRRLQRSPCRNGTSRFGLRKGSHFHCQYHRSPTTILIFRIMKDSNGRKNFRQSYQIGVSLIFFEDC